MSVSSRVDIEGHECECLIVGQVCYSFLFLCFYFYENAKEHKDIQINEST